MRKTRHPHLLRLSAALIFVAYPGGGGTLSAEPGEIAASAAATLVPLPKTPWPGFSDMVIEPRGPVWVMANNRLFYWDGSEFREPVSGDAWQRVSVDSPLNLTGLKPGSHTLDFAAEEDEFWADPSKGKRAASLSPAARPRRPTPAAAPRARARVRRRRMG
jgi:hypothetical protein